MAELADGVVVLAHGLVSLLGFFIGLLAMDRLFPLPLPEPGKTGGIVTTIDPASGALLKEGRAGRALGEYYASPVAADGRVYVANLEGTISVIESGGQWRVLAQNNLAEEISATPALANGRLYVRTRGAVYCFAGGRASGPAR